MLKKKQVRLALLIAVLGMVLAACSAAATPAAINTSAPNNTLAPTNTVAPAETSAPENTSSNSLVGKWEGTDVELGALTIEFKSDGVYEITASSGTFTATYEMVDDNTFNLIDPSGLSATVDFVRSGDTLTMTMDGSTLELHRVP